jgi:hypothetical protein
VLELLDAEEQVLIGLPGWNPGPTQALLHGGVHQAACSRRALVRPVQNVRDYGAPLRTLYPALLDQTVDGLLNPLAGDSGGTYLQKDQAFQRLKHKFSLPL